MRAQHLGWVVAALAVAALAWVLLLDRDERVVEIFRPTEPPASSTAVAPSLAPVAPPSEAGPSLAPEVRGALRRDPTDEERREYEEFFAKRVASAPSDYAALVARRRREAEEQARKSVEAAEDVKRGGLLALVDAQRRRGGPVHDLVQGGAFESGFRAQKRGSTHRLVPRAPAPEKIDDGDVLQFLPGAHTFSVQRWRSKPFPVDLTFEGYGMDKTLVTFDEFNDPSGSLMNLTFRDMTVDCGNHYLFDVRSHDVTLRAERCRFVRFDMGAGGSLLFGVKGMAVWATDCRIEVGFGKSPPYGNVFRSSDPLLVRMEGTTIVGANLGYGGDGSTAVFRSCRFEDAPPGTKEALEGRGWIRAVDCVVEESPVALHTVERYRKTRPLSELSPDWAIADRR